MRITEHVQQASDWFYGWEWRGRGSFPWGVAVEPEPPFLTFIHHPNPEPVPLDDGRIPNIFDRLRKPFQKPKPPVVDPTLERYLSYYVNPQPILLAGDEELMALQLSFPEDFRLTADHMEHLLVIISRTHYPLSFELVADSE